MKRSIERILTTHLGSLPQPPELLHAVVAKDRGEAFDEAAFPALLERSVWQGARIASARLW